VLIKPTVTNVRFFANALKVAFATSFGLCPNPDGNGGELNPADLKKLLDVGPGQTQRHLHPAFFNSYDNPRVKVFTNDFVPA
jgi:hypothetical protein